MMGCRSGVETNTQAEFRAALQAASCASLVYPGRCPGLLSSCTFGAKGTVLDKGIGHLAPVPCGLRAAFSCWLDMARLSQTEQQDFERIRPKYKLAHSLPGKLQESDFRIVGGPSEAASGPSGPTTKLLFSLRSPPGKALPTVLKLCSPGRPNCDSG